MVRLSALRSLATRYRGLAGIVACAAVGLLSSPGVAGTLTVDSRSIPGLTPKAPIVSHRLRLTGMIETPDASRLRAELEKLRQARGDRTDGPLAVLELSSKGGNLLEGIKIGYLLREFGVATAVRHDDACLSACALAFLGGTGRRQGGTAAPARTLEIGGQIGFHNFSVNVAWVLNETRSDPARGIARGFDLARTGAAQMMRYVTDMGVSPAFVAGLVALPPEQWQYVETAGDFLDLGIEPRGTWPGAGRLEVQAANVCGHALGQPVDPSRARRSTGRQAQRRLIEHVRNTVAGVDLKGPLAAQLSAVLDTSDQRLIDGVYGDLRAAGLPLPAPGTTHVEIPVPTGDGAPRQCHVSLSAGDLDTFDLVIVSERGIARVDRLPSGALARLLRHAADDKINQNGGRGRDLAARGGALGQLTNAD